jgi:ribonuclease E
VGEEATLETAEVALPPWVEPESPMGPASHAELLPAGAGISPPSGERAGDEEGGRPRTRFRRLLLDAADPEEVRIALVENDRLEELHYERPCEKKYLGNIYLGRVVNIEPAIQAAFVEIGIGRNGFLHVSDVLPVYKGARAVPIDSLSQRLGERRRLKIQEVLETGQEILVQISKDAIGAKGPSLTTYVSVPGKFLVLMPGVNRLGVSKRIEDDRERATLRASLANLSPPKGLGYILRTAGQGRTQPELEKDFQYLMRVWDEIREKVGRRVVPSPIYAESSLVIRSLRDLFGSDIDEMLIDDEAIYCQAREFLDGVMPEAAKRVRHYTGTLPIFSKFGIEEEIDKIYNRRVPLPSGGHIVVEQTEALVAIDVNSGKYRDEEDLEATALKTNLEAAEEIARQLRLRDLGGVIINDFIDMEVEANRREVERALRAALKRDRAKSWISRISRFGIIEMTRQRVRPSFERSNHEPCKLCRGTGVVQSARSSGTSILRQIRAGIAAKRRSVCEVVVHPDVAEYLLNDRRASLVELEAERGKAIRIRANPGFSPEQYEIRYH